jgi:hypothetical protein
VYFQKISIFLVTEFNRVNYVKYYKLCSAEYQII